MITIYRILDDNCQISEQQCKVASDLLNSKNIFNCNEFLTFLEMEDYEIVKALKILDDNNIKYGD